MSSTPGSAGRATSAQDRRISEGCATGFAHAGRRPVRASLRWGSRRCGRRASRSSQGCARAGRDLIARGLGAPMLIVADGAPGLIKAVEQCWPASDRQHCAVHRVRNPLAKLPERERERVRDAYWQALDEAINERDGKQRLTALVEKLDQAGYTAAARCLADDLDALVVHLCYPLRHRRRWRSTDLLERSLGEVKRAVPRSSAASPARPAASHSSGPCSTSTSPTPPTASSSLSSSANASSG
jgi:mutator family transposase